MPSDGVVTTDTTVEADVQTGSSPSVPSTIDIPAQTTVTLPAGAANQISVASASVTPSSNPSETTFSVVPGLAVDAEPSGTTFSNPVTISFTLSPAEYASVLTQAGDNPSGITIKYQEPGSATWTALQTTVTVSGTNYVISAQTTRFCTFAVFSSAPSSPHGGGHSAGTYYWANTGSTGSSGYTGPEPTVIGYNPTPVQPTGTPAVKPQSQQVAGSIPVVVQQTVAAPPAASTAPWGGIPVVPAVFALAGIGVIGGGGLLVRRWWIRRQNPALFRKYD